ARPPATRCQRWLKLCLTSTSSFAVMLLERSGRSGLTRDRHVRLYVWPPMIPLAQSQSPPPKRSRTSSHTNRGRRARDELDAKLLRSRPSSRCPLGSLRSKDGHAGALPRKLHVPVFPG